MPPAPSATLWEQRPAVHNTPHWAIPYSVERAVTLHGMNAVIQSLDDAKKRERCT
jgi:hypothetical protein